MHDDPSVRICVFLQGTILMHSGAVGRTRGEIIRQVKDQESSVRNFLTYVPIAHAVEKLRYWSDQGAEIVYLSALTEDKRDRGDEVVGADGLKADEEVLSRWNFPRGVILHRRHGETYRDVIEALDPSPHVLIEDDCESIGGRSEMTYPSLHSDTKTRITSVVVPEFGGIDHLPDDPHLLRVCKDHEEAFSNSFE